MRALACRLSAVDMSTDSSLKKTVRMAMLRRRRAAVHTSTDLGEFGGVVGCLALNKIQVRSRDDDNKAITP